MEKHIYHVKNLAMAATVIKYIYIIFFKNLLFFYYLIRIFLERSSASSFGYK